MQKLILILSISFALLSADVLVTIFDGQTGEEIGQQHVFTTLTVEEYVETFNEQENFTIIEKQPSENRLEFTITYRDKELYYIIDPAEELVSENLTEQEVL